MCARRREEHLIERMIHLMNILEENGLEVEEILESGWPEGRIPAEVERSF